MHEPVACSLLYSSIANKLRWGLLLRPCDLVIGEQNERKKRSVANSESPASSMSPMNPRKTRLITRTCCNRWATIWLAGFVTGIVISVTFLVVETFVIHSIDDNRAPTRRVRLRMGSVDYHNYNGRNTTWVRKVQRSGLVRKAGGQIVLVPGAAGFIGFYLSLAMRKKGYGVVGLDNFNQFYDPALKRQRQAMLQNSGVFIVEGDINDKELLKQLFKMVKFTHVLHLAAQVGTRYAEEDPHSYVQSNIAGLVSLLEVCAMMNPQPAIIWASSSSVYGLNTERTSSEDHRTDQSASLYGATKKGGEEIVYAYNHVHQLSFTILRFFTVYGPWGHPDMTLFGYTKAILEGEPITVLQGPNNRTEARDWTFISDIVTGCLAAVETAERSKGGKLDRNLKKLKSRSTPGSAQLRVFNLGCGQAVPLVKIVRILERYLNKTAVIIFKNTDNNGDMDNHSQTVANITLAQTNLGYYPRTDLSMGLKEFAEWYLNYYSTSMQELAKP